ncbi:MAG: LysR substrate-binding domain-containing protein [Pontibacterium sp.]
MDLITPSLAPPVVKQFRRIYPDVRIHIYEGLEASAVEKLRMGEIDFSVTSIAASTTLSEKEFIIHPIIKIPMAIICRSGHPLQDKTSLQDLLVADWVQIGAGGHLTPIIRNFYLQHGLQAPNVAVECHSFTSSLAMIDSTDLLGIVPEAWISDVYYTGKFAKISVREGLATNQLQMLLRRDKPLIPVAQTFSTLFLRLADVD